jgi:hypothetical protein
MADPPTVTDWISAISTAALGVLGVVITVSQGRKSGFLPRLTSRIDAANEAIELRVANRGRAGGIVDQSDLLDPDHSIVEDAVFEGFTAARSGRWRCPRWHRCGSSSRRLGTASRPV